MKYKIGDKVTLLRPEMLDDAYHDKDRTVLPKDTVMEVIAVTPKVCMLKKGVKLEGHDNNPYFLNLVIPNTTYPRVRTDFCNVKKIKYSNKLDNSKTFW